MHFHTLVLLSSAALGVFAAPAAQPAAESTTTKLITTVVTSNLYGETLTEAKMTVTKTVIETGGTTANPVTKVTSPVTSPTGATSITSTGALTDPPPAPTTTHKGSSVVSQGSITSNIWAPNPLQTTGCLQRTDADEIAIAWVKILNTSVASPQSDIDFFNDMIAADYRDYSGSAAALDRACRQAPGPPPTMTSPDIPLFTNSKQFVFAQTHANPIPATGLDMSFSCDTVTLRYEMYPVKGMKYPVLGINMIKVIQYILATFSEFDTDTWVTALGSSCITTNYSPPATSPATGVSTVTGPTTTGGPETSPTSTKATNPTVPTTPVTNKTSTKTGKATSTQESSTANTTPAPTS